MSRKSTNFLNSNQINSIEDNKMTETLEEKALWVGQTEKAPWGVGKSKEEITYAGMPSRDSFALILTDFNGKNPRTLFFPTKNEGKIQLCIPCWYNVTIQTLQILGVKEVSPEYIKLEQY